MQIPSFMQKVVVKTPQNSPSKPEASWLPSLQSVLMTSVSMIMVLSLLMVASASIPFAQTKNLGDFYFFYHQLAYMGIGLILGYLVYLIPLRLTFRLDLIMWAMAFCVLMIIYTLFAGSVINGSRRWIEFGGINFQPVELAKLLMIIFTSDYLVRRSEEIRYHWKGFLRLTVIAAGLALFIMLQPDFGSVVIIVCCTAAMIFVGGLPKSQFLIVVGAMLTAGAIGVMSASYRLKRALSFVDPFDDLRDTDYQLGRSIVAFARGEWFGVGYGESVQKLSHLPEAHTDFLLAITGEELGLVGVMFLLLLELTLIITVMKISYDALKRRQSRLSYFAFGVGVLFFGQVFVNAGMTMGMLPTKGLTMPFFSYGGSSMVINLMIIGILFRILKESPVIPQKEGRYY
ncbi:MULTISPECIES: putative lipid II flippase FtsW [unclassified Moraxella]|uniref:putative lipid II flippase FtsW n=1 Tax=unclassified Moraxella TaxID=2685852 RepID=UPI003AF8DF70